MSETTRRTIVQLKWETGNETNEGDIIDRLAETENGIEFEILDLGKEWEWQKFNLMSHNGTDEPTPKPTGVELYVRSNKSQRELDNAVTFTCPDVSAAMNLAEDIAYYSSSMSLE